MNQEGTSQTTEHQSARSRGVSQWALAWRRLKKNKTAIAGLALVGAFVVMAAFDRLVALYPPRCIVGLNPSCPSPDFVSNGPPTLAHPFGTNIAGYDVYSEIIYGTRAAFLIGLGSTGLAITIAVIIGLVAGYFGGWMDNLLMRITEVFLVIPFFLLLLVFLQIALKFSQFSTGGIWIVVLVIGAFSWPGAARIIRGETLKVREFEFIAASRQIGASSSRILFRHLFPNVLHIVIVLLTLQIAASILTEAAVSFLGFGAPGSNTWGQQMYTSANFIADAWWATLFPALFVTVMVMGFNLLGNGLRDALDPRLRE
jgi:peptide/nickel transport system permease protein